MVPAAASSLVTPCIESSVRTFAPLPAFWAMVSATRWSEFFHLAGQEGHRLKAGLRLGRAAGESRVVVQAVVLHQVAEGEPVAEQQGVHRRSVHRRLVFPVQRGQPFGVGGGIGGKILRVGGVQPAHGIGDGPGQDPGVAQGQPDVLVVLGAAVVGMAVVVLMTGLHPLGQLLQTGGVPQHVQQADHLHVLVDGLLQSVVHPVVRGAAHIQEQIAGGHQQHILGGGLVAVHIDAGVLQPDQFDAGHLAQHLPSPVVDGEDGGHHPQGGFVPAAGGGGRAGVFGGGRAAPGQQGQGEAGRRQGGQGPFQFAHAFKTSVRGKRPRAKRAAGRPFGARPPRNCNLTANYYTHQAGGCQ